jgi:hypothetical protein
MPNMMISIEFGKKREVLKLDPDAISVHRLKVSIDCIDNASAEPLIRENHQQGASNVDQFSEP